MTSLVASHRTRRDNGRVLMQVPPKRPAPPGVIAARRASVRAAKSGSPGWAYPVAAAREQRAASSALFSRG